MHPYKFSFEKLEVWQLARELAYKVYLLTQYFPNEEKFGLQSQIRRAAVSVASNIAEGAARSSAKDQAHFTTIAFGSLMELFSQLMIAADLNYITSEQLELLREQVQILSVKLSNLKASQLKHV